MNDTVPEVDNPMLDVEMQTIPKPTDDEIASEVQEYKNILEVESVPLKMFGFTFASLRLNPAIQAFMSIIVEITLVVLFFLSNNEDGGGFGAQLGGYILSSLFIFVCWIVVPIWQNIVLISKASGERTESCNNGCVFVLCCYRSCAFCCGKYKLAWRDDKSSVSTRFIPFSIYNNVYAVLHPGKQLNHRLPAGTEIGVGFTRVYLTILSGLWKAIFTSVAFSLSIYCLFDTRNRSPAKTALNTMIFILSALDYRIYLINVILLIRMLPLHIGIFFGCFFPDYCGMSNPRGNGCYYRNFLYYWDTLVKWE